MLCWRFSLKPNCLWQKFDFLWVWIELSLHHTFNHFRKFRQNRYWSIIVHHRFISRFIYRRHLCTLFTRWKHRALQTTVCSLQTTSAPSIISQIGISPKPEALCLFSFFKIVWTSLEFVLINLKVLIWYFFLLRNHLVGFFKNFTGIFSSSFREEISFYLVPKTSQPINIFLKLSWCNSLCSF